MRILNQRVLDIYREGAFPKPYEYKDHPKQCFNCHQYDHQKAICKNPLRCGFYAAEDTVKGTPTQRMRSARHAEDLTQSMIRGAEHTKESWERW